MIVYIVTRLVGWLFNLRGPLEDWGGSVFFIPAAWIELIVEVPVFFVLVFLVLADLVRKEKGAGNQ